MLSKLLPTLRSALVCTLTLAATASFAATLNVGPGQPYTTIQSAINAAANGDTVLVAPGTYFENIDFIGKAITVTSSGGAAVTIIDGSAKTGVAVVTFQSKEVRSSVISNFTIRNGGLGAATTEGAGGVYVGGAAPTILNNTITGNACYGVYVNFGDALIQGNEINNTSGVNGGYCTETGAAVFLIGNNNLAGFSHSSIIGNTIENNISGSYAGGVGFFAAEGSLLQGNIIRNNKGNAAGALSSVNTVSMSIVQNLVYNNVATGAGLDSAGAFAVLPPEASVGAFIGVIANNTIAYNSATTITSGQVGAQVELEGNLGQYVVVNNLIVGASSSEPAFNCGQIYSYLSVTPLVFDHNDIYNSAGPAYGGACTDQTGSYGNISVDPQFVNASNGNFQLPFSSPAIDAGNNSATPLLPLDLAGSPRLQDTTGKGYPIVDMGAYEFSGTGFPSSGELAPTTLTLSPSSFTPFSFGSTQPFSLTANAASASGVPTGPITFYEDLQVVGTANLNASGVATLQPPVPTPGLHAFIATYPGQGPFSPAVSVKFYVLFPKYTPTIKITSSPNPSQLNSPVLFTVTITSSDNTILSPITLTDSSTNTVLATLTPNASGVATFTTSSLPLGYSNITASYAGDAEHNSASASVYQDVVSGYATITTLTCAPNPISINATTLCTVAVNSANGTPTGSVTLTDNGPTLATLPLTNGSATYSYTGTTAGTHTLTASYPTTGTFNASTNSFALTVDGLPTTTTASVSPEPSTYGQPTVFTVHVAPVTPTAAVPTGKVLLTFCNGATITITLDATGSGSVTTPISGSLPEPVGSCPFTANYQGDTTFNSSTSASIPYIVNPSPSTTTIVATPNPAYALNPVTVTVTVTGTPSPTLGPGGQIIPSPTVTATGTVSLLDGTIFVGTAKLSNGIATFTVTTLAIGQHTLTANFAPDFNLTASSASTTETILPNNTSTTLTAIPNPAYLSQTVTIVATVASSSTSAPGSIGTITFYDGTTILGTQPVTAALTATFTTSTLAVGSHPITATFTPTNAAFTPSTATPVNEVVLPSGFSIALSPSTITLSPGASGTTTIQLSSIGNFAGPLTLTSGTPPTYATVAINPATVTLAAGGSTTSTLSIKTLFKAANAVPTRPGSKELPVVFAAITLLFVPFALRRRKTFTRLLTLALAIVALQAITGCTNSFYIADFVAAGTYQLPVTATDANNNSQTATLTVVVTP